MSFKKLNFPAWDYADKTRRSTGFYVCVCVCVCHLNINLHLYTITWIIIFLSMALLVTDWGVWTLNLGGQDTSSGDLCAGPQPPRPSLWNPGGGELAHSSNTFPISQTRLFLSDLWAGLTAFDVQWGIIGK